MAPGLSRSSLGLAAVAVAAVVLLALPLPGAAVDALLAANLLLATALLVLVVAAAQPLALRSFPALLLICAVLRLSVAVAAARLGIARGPSAGLSIVAEALLGGSAAAAGVVFVGLSVVHQLVVAKGAERIAEVSARFALDALPGRQLGIDGDVRSGALDAAGARRARAELALDGQLFAAMDGAMKFVRGEAIAAIVIVAVVVVGAALAGVAAGVGVAEAARRAALLAAAVGVAAQIPALLAALASALLAARAGAPEMAGLGGAVLRQVRRAMDGGQSTETRLLVEAAPAARDEADAIVRRIDGVLADLGLPPSGGAFRPRSDLAGRDCRVWLDDALLADTRGLGPAAVDAAVRRHAHTLLGIEETQRLVDELAATHPALVRETARAVETGVLADALRRLVREGVPVRPLREVLEAVVRRPAGEVRAAELAEHIRSARARALTLRFCPGSRASAIVLDAEAEDAIRESVRGEQVALDPDVLHDLLASMRRLVEAAGEDRPLVLCAPDVRRHVRALTESDFPDLPVLSYPELLPEVAIDELGRIPTRTP
jgi:type III secretion protein V